MFPVQSVSENSLIATFQLSSAASLNLGLSQNGVLGNGLTSHMDQPVHTFLEFLLLIECLAQYTSQATG